MRRKKTPAEKLAAAMAQSFEATIAKRLDDPTAKRFFVALMLALPTISGHEMNGMVAGILDRHLGNKKIDEILEGL